MNAVAGLVIDTSVAVKWFFDEPHTPEALRVLAACRAGSRRPLAPDLIYPEFGNAVWKRVIQRQLDAEDGAGSLDRGVERGVGESGEGRGEQRLGCHSVRGLIPCMLTPR